MERRGVVERRPATNTAIDPCDDLRLHERRPVAFNRGSVKRLCGAAKLKSGQLRLHHQSSCCSEGTARRQQECFHAGAFPIAE
jgi:hypothetical protein